MACFITPLTLGIIIDVVKRLMGKAGIKLRLDILEKMLLGGSLVLAVEHVWHGEVVPYPPFLTAMSNPADIPVMLHEITYVGGLMSMAVTATWLGMLVYTRSRITSRKLVKQLTGAISFNRV